MKVDIDEADRQMLLLSLGLCALLRPGFHYACGEIAETLQGRAMFEDFRRLNADVVHPQAMAEATNKTIAQQDPELFIWLQTAAGHFAPERPAAGSFLRNLAEAGLRADWDNYPILRPVLLQMKAKYPKYSGEASQ